MKGLALLVLLVGAARAQDSGGAGAPSHQEALRAIGLAAPLPPGTDTSDVALLAALGEDNLLTARRLAEARLEVDPRSMTAHYVLGMALWKEEGELGRANAALEDCIDLFRDGGRVDDGEAWRVHAKALGAAQDLAGQMGEYDRQLDLIGDYNRLYDPDIDADRAWALMMVGDTDEALAVARGAAASEERWRRSTGLNALCAILSKQGLREQAWEACLQALEDERAAPLPDVTVDAHNAALAARASLRFTEARELSMEAVRGGISGVSIPWILLAQLALAEGRGQDATQAVLEAQRWRAAQEPELRDQSRALCDRTLAELLLVAGETSRGLRIIRRALDQPDRQGLTTGTRDRALAAQTALLLELRRAHAERVREQATRWRWPRRVVVALRLALRELASWDERATVRSVLAQPDMLRDTFAAYQDDGLEIAPWWVGELVPLVGPGVAAAALDDARDVETLRGFNGYYIALEADIAAARGDWDEALPLARSALVALPDAEELLRARVQVVAARAAWRTGDRALARTHYQAAMQIDPGVLRRMAEPLPARVEAHGLGRVAGKATTMLRRSPRFRSDDEGFVVSVEGAGDELRACLRSPLGDRLACADAPPAEEGWSDADKAAALVDAFHLQAFAMPLGLSNIDSDSLDGTTTIVKEAAREQVRQLLEGAE